jgi:hypothetical protein
LNTKSNQPDRRIDAKIAQRNIDRIASGRQQRQVKRISEKAVDDGAGLTVGEFGVTADQ